MDEYIKREDVLRAYEEEQRRPGPYRFETLIKSVQTADVALVRHGLWVKRGCKWQCTNCKVLMSIDGTPKENLLNYCPNCGCLMDGGDDE